MKQNIVVRDQLQKMSKKTGISADTLTRSAVGISGLVAVGSIAGAVLVHPLFWAVTVFGTVAVISTSAIRAIALPQVLRRLNRSSKRITNAQVTALIDPRRKTISARRLATSTNSTVEAAEEKLRSLVVDGVLDIDVDQSESDTIYVLK